MNAARMTAVIGDNCLDLTCIDTNDPYYQLFATDIVALGDGKLPFVGGDTLSLTFDAIIPSEAGASVKWIQSINGAWKSEDVKLAESASFMRYACNFKINDTATGFMVRFIVRTVGVSIKIKNIVLTKGNVSPNFFPSVSDVVKLMDDKVIFEGNTIDINALMNDLPPGLYIHKFVGNSTTGAPIASSGYIVTHIFSIAHATQYTYHLDGNRYSRRKADGALKEWVLEPNRNDIETLKNNLDTKVSKAGGAVTGTLFTQGGASVYYAGGEALNTNGYIKIATITISTGYMDYPIFFEFTTRTEPKPMQLYLMFKSTKHSDPEVNTFQYSGSSLNAYIKKSGTGVWDLYLKKNAWAGITVSEYKKDLAMVNGVKTVFQNTIVETLPAGAIQATDTNKEQVECIQLMNDDLDTLKGNNYTQYYWSPGGNTCINKPPGVNGFGLAVERTATTYWTQTLTVRVPVDPQIIEYKRTFDGAVLVWTDWYPIQPTGLLSGLTTTKKSSVVEAINEVNANINNQKESYLSTVGVTANLKLDRYKSYILTMQHSGGKNNYVAILTTDGDGNTVIAPIQNTANTFTVGVDGYNITLSASTTYWRYVLKPLN